jgi:hypothetical protein
MNDSFSHKLYNHTAEPPASAWEKIALALDESHLSDKFTATLQNAVANPPASAWASIAASLEELELSNQYPATLANMEVAPPATAWEKISQSLHTGEETPAKEQRRIFPVLRYAAAAVFVGFVAFGAVKLLNNKKENNGLAGTTEIPGKQNSDSPLNNDTAINTDQLAEEVVQSQDAIDAAALEESKGTFASLDMSDRQKMRKINQDLFMEEVSTVNTDADLILPEAIFQRLECTDVAVPAYAATNAAIDMASRYSLLMTADGHIVRVSKKLSGLICCVSGEEQDENCKTQLNQWKKKIADSPVAPSPGNFMDILSLLQTLKESNL